MANRGKKLAVVSIITYIFIELTCYLFIKTGYIKTRLPDFHYKFDITEYPLQVADIDSLWGTWHYPEGLHRTEDCLSFNYSINSFGARDKERIKNSPDSQRVFVLGDSFMEGYGMDENQRLTNLLEKKTQREFLNFACTNFGTTQEYLVYKKWGHQFNHSTLLLGILPYNDFEDNDTSIHQNPYYKLFRPYYKGTYPDYRLVYCEDSIQKTNFNKAGFFRKENSWKGRITRFLNAYTCWFHIVTYIKDLDVTSKYKQKLGYYDFTRGNLNKMFFILNKIKQETQTKRFIVITIPVAEDIKKYKLAGTPPLHEAFDSFCKKNQIEYLDLLPEMAAQQNAENKFFFDCDRHWNEAGNQFAADILDSLFR